MNQISSAATKSLTIRYLLALFAIATTCLAGQLVVQSLLSRTRSHADVINLAGRQRMLSQRIAKITYHFAADPQSIAAQSWLAELSTSVEQLQRMDHAIRDGDAGLGIPPLESNAARDQLSSVSPALEALTVSAARLRELVETGRYDSPAARQLSEQVQVAESQFLSGMDSVVALVSADSSARIEHLISVQRWITFATLTLLLLEAVFVFRPAVRRTGDAIQGLGLALSQARSATKNAETAVADRNVALSAAAMDLRRLSAEIDALLLEQVALAAPRDGHRFRMLVAHVQGTLGKLTDLAANGDDDGEELVVSRTSPRGLIKDAIQTFRHRTADQVDVQTTMDVRLPASLLVDEQLFHDSIVYLLQSMKDLVGSGIFVHLGYDDRELQLIVEITAATDHGDDSRVPSDGDGHQDATPSEVTRPESESLDWLLAKRTVERLGGTVRSSVQYDHITVRLPLDETKPMTLFAKDVQLQKA